MSRRRNYHKLHKSKELQKRVDKAISMLSSCTLCPRNCGVNRLEGEEGGCKTGRYAKVSSFSPHFGEEAPLVGIKGSGTVFFTNCNLKCIFCQNYDISQLGFGKETKPENLANIMISLQDMGCHNINLVSPSHVTAQVLEALPFAVKKGLNIAIVYNSNGYDSVETLSLLDGIVDIYMPDFKYGDDKAGKKYSGVKGYFKTACLAVKEMQKQAGDLVMDGGIAKKGLIIRHLVMPNDAANSKKVIDFIAENISKKAYVNIMEQYRPEYNAKKHKELSRPVTMEEFNTAVSYTKQKLR